jgi:hypothetical protein
MASKWTRLLGFGEDFRNCTKFDHNMPIKSARWPPLNRRTHGKVPRAGAKSGKTSNQNG